MKMMAMMLAAMMSVGAAAWAQTPAAPVHIAGNGGGGTGGGAAGASTGYSRAGRPVSAGEPEELHGDFADDGRGECVSEGSRGALTTTGSGAWRRSRRRRRQVWREWWYLPPTRLQPGKVSRNEFFMTPDGKHAIAGGVVDFGAKPFEAASRAAAAGGEWTGGGSGEQGLLLVEFADLLNARSKEAQDAVNNLMKDIPQARIVFENLPADGSPYALRAAAEGVCVRKAKGDAAFFTYMQAVYSKQKGLTAATLQPALDAAVVAAGADAKSVAACAVSPATKADVEASIALAAKGRCGCGAGAGGEWQGVAADGCSLRHAEADCGVPGAAGWHRVRFSRRFPTLSR